MSKAAGGPGLSVRPNFHSTDEKLTAGLCVNFGSSLTEDVDVDGGGGAAAAVGGLDDVGGAVVSLGLGDCDGGVSRLGLKGHSVVRFEDQVGLGPFHPGLRFSRHLGGELDLAAGLGGETGQEFSVQLDLRRLCGDS